MYNKLKLDQYINSIIKENSENLENIFNEYWRGNQKKVAMFSEFDVATIVDERICYSHIWESVIQLKDVVDNIKHYKTQIEYLDKKKYEIDNSDKRYKYNTFINRFNLDKRTLEIQENKRILENNISNLQKYINLSSNKSLWDDALQNRVVTYFNENKNNLNESTSLNRDMGFSYKSSIENNNIMQYVIYKERYAFDYDNIVSNMTKLLKLIFEFIYKDKNEFDIKAIYLNSLIESQSTDKLKEYFDKKMQLEIMEEMYDTINMLLRYLEIIEDIKEAIEKLKKIQEIVKQRINKITNILNKIKFRKYKSDERVSVNKICEEINSQLVMISLDDIYDLDKKNKEYKLISNVLNELEKLGNLDNEIKLIIFDLAELEIILQLNIKLGEKKSSIEQKNITAFKEILEIYKYIINFIKVDYSKLNSNQSLDNHLIKLIWKYNRSTPKIKFTNKIRSEIVNSDELEVLIDEIEIRKKNIYSMKSDDANAFKVDKIMANEIEDLEEKLKENFDYYGHRLQKNVIQKQLEIISVGYILTSAMIDTLNKQNDEDFYKIFKNLKEALLKEGKNTLLESYLRQYREESK